ncbi:MAG: multidrug efflux RND transporter permease subunit [Planctomycetota bacterium]
MISRFFIFRPVFATVIAVVTVLAGAISLPLLPVEQYPEITPPTVRVTARYPGADAKTLVDTVTTPLEQAINGVEGSIYIKSSSSADGSVAIDVSFALGEDPDFAAILVQNRVNTALARLPEEVTRQGVNVNKRSPSLLMVASLVSDLEKDPQNGEQPGQESPIYDYAFLSNYATLYVLDTIRRVDGVGEASLFGARDYAMRVWLDADKLQARNLTTVDILEALRAQNVQVAAGELDGQPTDSDVGFTYTLLTQGRLADPEQFKEIILRIGDEQQSLRLGDVARVELGAETYSGIARRNQLPGAQIAVYQLPGSNAVSTVDGVRRALEEASANFPDGLRYELTFDSTTFVRASIEEVVITLIVAAILVIATVFIFLQDWRATLVPAVTIPVSLVGTFAILLVFGYSLNLLTLFGLVLAIGIVVDDAIVVVENVSRLIQERACDAAKAATDAMTEITGPIIATTLVVLAVFIPAAMLPGMTGQLYRQFAVTLSVATVISSINALTLAPALCALLLKPVPESGGSSQSKLARLVFTPFNKAFDFTTGKYTWVVRKFIAIPLVVVLLYAGLAALTGWSILRTPTGFLPDEDQGYLFVNIQLPDAAKLGRTDAVLQDVEKILEQQEGVKDVIAVNGFSLLAGGAAPNYALAVAVLDHWDERPDHPAPRILGEIMPPFFGLTDGQVFAFNPPSIPGLGTSGGFDYQLLDQSAQGLDVLQNAANNLIFAANQHPGIQQPFTGFRTTVPQRYIDIDRTQLLKRGVPIQSVFDTLQTALGSAYVNDFNYFGRVYRVYAQADTQFRQSIDDLRRLTVRNNDGDMVPLDSFVKIDESSGPQSVTRYNLFPAVGITGQGAPGVSSGQAIDIMADLSDQTLPDGMTFAWSGITYQQLEAGAAAPIAFGLGILVVFLVLAAQYESWTIPFAILLAVPLGLLGAMLGLNFRGMANDIYAQIGLVLLIALVAKNAILIVEFSKQQRDAGKPAPEAALEAARLRFRPILMTAFSFILGTAPLMFASGAGANARQVLGTTVVVGMGLATVIGILLIPSFDVIIQSIGSKLRGSKPPNNDDC